MLRKVEIKTHKFVVVFNDGSRINSYSEDVINGEEPNIDKAVLDGVEVHLDRLSKPGMIRVGEDTWRPHSTINAIQLVDSNVTRILEVEFSEKYGLWEIISED